MIEGGAQAFSLEAVEVIEAGDLAVEIGRYTLAIRTRAQSLGSIKARPLWYGADSMMAASNAIDTFTSDTGP